MSDTEKWRAPTLQALALLIDPSPITDPDHDDVTPTASVALERERAEAVMVAAAVALSTTLPAHDSTWIILYVEHGGSLNATHLFHLPHNEIAHR